MYPTHEIHSLAASLLSRAIHQLWDTAWMGGQWTMKRPGIFSSLLSIFFTRPLYYVFSPYTYWFLLYHGIIVGKRIHPHLLLSLMPQLRLWSDSPSLSSEAGSTHCQCPQISPPAIHSWLSFPLPQLFLNYSWVILPNSW